MDPRLGLHDTQRPRGRHGPGARRGRAGGWSSSPTTRSGASSGSARSPGSTRPTPSITDSGLERRGSRELLRPQVRELVVRGSPQRAPANDRRRSAWSRRCGRRRVHALTTARRRSGARPAPPVSTATRSPAYRAGPIGATTRSSTSGCSCRPSGRAGRGRAREEPDRRRGRPAYDPDCYLCPGNRAGQRRREPGLRVDTFVFTNDFAALRPDATDERFEDGLLRAEGERGTVPGRLLLAAPRPDAGRMEPPATSGASSTCGPTRPPSSATATAGSRCSRTAARRWARRTPIRTARSGPAPRCPTRRPARTRPSGRTTARPAGACCSTTPPRSPAGRGSSSRTTTGSPSCRSGRPGRSRRWSSPKRPAARLPDLDATRPRRPGGRSCIDSARALRRPVRPAVPVLDGLAPGAVRGRTDRITGSSTPTSIPPLLDRQRPQVHGRLRAPRRDPARPHGGGRRRAARGRAPRTHGAERAVEATEPGLTGPSCSTGRARCRFGAAGSAAGSRARSWSRSARPGSAAPTSMATWAPPGRRRPGVVMGHEAAGDVVEVGPGRHVRAGRRPRGAPLDPAVRALRPLSPRPSRTSARTARAWACSSTAPTPSGSSSRRARCCSDARTR